jgi:FkbM family methyltransferase
MKTIHIIIIIFIIILIIFFIFKKKDDYKDNIEHYTKSYSQLNQDTKALEFFNYKKDGFFVEIGANDGITLSNTYLLEKEFGWKGICVEAIPELYNKLVINRPNSTCISKAVYKTSDEEIEFDVANDNLLSGISELISKNSVHYNNVKNNRKNIKVKTITFTDLLDQNNAPKIIDYLSLDTEGSEYDILLSLDFNKYKFKLIDVEHNYLEPARSNIKKLLLDNGYEYVGENNWDDNYKLKI